MAKRVSLTSGHRRTAYTGKGCRMCKSRPARTGVSRLVERRKKK